MVTSLRNRVGFPWGVVKASRDSHIEGALGSWQAGNIAHQ